jgi:hypothetical protein
MGFNSNYVGCTLFAQRSHEVCCECRRYSTIVLLQNTDLHEPVCLASYLLKVIVLPQLYETARFMQ